MPFTAQIATVADFKKAVACDPGLVFVSGVLNGRHVALTLSSVMEATNEIVIYGPEKNWRAYIRNENRISFTSRPKLKIYATLPFATKKGSATHRKSRASALRSKAHQTN